MNGIGGKPYIAADDYIDLEGIIALEKEICYGIARSEVQAGIYGPGIKDVEKYGNYLGHSIRYSKQEMANDERAMFASLTRNQRALFFKLYEGMYSASSVVYLRDFKNLSINSYVGKAREDNTKPTANIDYFPKLTEWIYKLPFKEIGRIIFFLHEHDCTLLTHRDGVRYAPHNNEFLWINPCGVKNFFIYDENTGDEHVVDCKAAFFNDLDMHGGRSNSKMTWSLRVDGIFTDEFRKQLGIDHLDTY